MVQYGTSLELVAFNKEHIRREFWGDDHCQQAQDALKVFIAVGPVCYHVFQPMQREILPEGV